MKQLFALLLVYTGLLQAQPKPLTSRSAEQTDAVKFLLVSKYAESRDDANSAWYAVDSAEYGYNSIGARTLERVFFYDQGTLTDAYNTYTSYLSNGQIDSDLVTGFLVDSGRYVDLSKTIRVYNSNKDQDTGFTYYWNSQTSQWDPGTLNVFTYHAAGKILDDFQYHWNKQTSKWENNFKISLRYDQNDSIISEVFQPWSTNDNDWANQHKLEFTYDNAGRLYQQLDFVWRNNWDTSSIREYHYGAGNKISLNFAYYYASNTLNTIVRYTHTFNTHGQDSILLEENYNPVQPGWKKFFYTEYTYNANDSLQQSEKYVWGSSNEWVRNRRQTYIYDNYRNMVYWMEEYFNTTSLMYEERNHKYYHYLQMDITAIAEIASIPLAVYPNPCTGDHIRLNYLLQQSARTTITLYDALGRPMYMERVMAMEAENTAIISLQSLPAGVYYVQIRNEHTGTIGTLPVVKR